MRTVRRIGVILFVILEFVFLGLPYELQNLYDTRLGFMRQILYMNENYPLALIRWLFGAMLLLSVFAFAILYVRYHRKKQRRQIINTLWLGLLWVVVLALLIHADKTNPLFLYRLFAYDLVLGLQLLVVMLTRQRKR